MKHALALIISQTSSRSAKMSEHLQRAEWKTLSAAPDQALASAVKRSPDLVLLCGCDDTAVSHTLETLKLDHRTAGISTALCGHSSEDETSVRILPDFQTGADDLSALLADLSGSVRALCDITFRVPNHCRFIDALTTYLDRVYEQFHVDAESNHRLTTAVREMVHNAIEWGNRGVAHASVRVACRIESQAVSICVRDGGAGFNREALPHAATSQDPTRHLHVRDALGLRAGGFGILMTRGLVDELSYNEAGNEVRIVKRLPAPK